MSLQTHQMTLQQKAALCAKAEACPEWRQGRLAHWAQTNFHLAYMPSQPISRIVKEGEKYKAILKQDKNLTRHRSVQFPELDLSLIHTRCRKAMASEDHNENL